MIKYKILFLASLLFLTGCAGISAQATKIEATHTFKDGRFIQMSAYGKAAVEAFNQTFNDLLRSQGEPVIGEPVELNVVPLPEASETDGVLRP